MELQIAACVNLLPPAQSIYRWKGEIESKTEVPVFIKTTHNNFHGVESRIRESHPDEIPEVIAIPIDQGSSDYLAWVSDVTFD